MTSRRTGGRSERRQGEGNGDLQWSERWICISGSKPVRPYATTEKRNVARERIELPTRGKKTKDTK